MKAKYVVRAKKLRELVERKSLREIAREIRQVQELGVLPVIEGGK